jgi:hypothetical protein
MATPSGARPLAEMLCGKVAEKCPKARANSRSFQLESSENFAAANKPRQRNNLRDGDRELFELFNFSHARRVKSS